MIVNQTNVGERQLNPSDGGEAIQRIYNISGILNYDRIFNDHGVSANLLYYQYRMEVDGRINNSRDLYRANR